MYNITTNSFFLWHHSEEPFNISTDPLRFAWIGSVFAHRSRSAMKVSKAGWEGKGSCEPSYRRVGRQGARPQGMLALHFRLSNLKRGGCCAKACYHKLCKHGLWHGPNG